MTLHFRVFLQPIISAQFISESASLGTRSEALLTAFNKAKKIFAPLRARARVRVAPPVSSLSHAAVVLSVDALCLLYLLDTAFFLTSPL
jgi:hypothetical protein